MNEENLYEFYLSLLPNLLNELFFFIPEKQIPEFAHEMLLIFKKHDMLNKVMVIDKYYGPMHYERERDNKSFILKLNNLEKNIFMLLEKKSKLSRHQFDYTLDKYYELMKIMYKITDWMHLNLAEHIQTDDNISGIFYMQSTYFQSHFKNLVKTFYKDRNLLPKGNFDVNNLIDTCFGDVSKSLKKHNDVGIEHLKPKKNLLKLNLPENVNANAELKNTGENGGKPLITELEAEKILLKTFFGIQK